MQSTSMPRISAEAPGRVNLIGEHTDYHDGYVMPCAVPQRTRASLQVRSDRRVFARSAEMSSAPFEYELGREHPTREWGDYVQGLTWVLARDGFAIDVELPDAMPQDVRGDPMRLRFHLAAACRRVRRSRSQR